MKKQKLFFICFAVLALAVLFAFSGFSAVRGDVNRDGVVQAEDARLCLRQAVGLERFAKGSEQFKACDYSNDGNVTAEDARLILRVAVGLPTDDETPRPQTFKVPMVVYESNRGVISLTKYQTRYDSERQEMVLECVFSIKNNSYVPYDPVISGVTVNGLQIMEPEIYGNQVHPNSTVNMQVLIPGRYFDISQSGNAVVDELLVHFDLFDVSTQSWLFANAAVYPTNKTPGAAVRYAADKVEYKKSKETSDFIFGLQNATYHWRTENGVKYVDYIDSLFYFKNKSNRDLYVDLYDITINKTIEFEHDVSLYVFAGTAAEPEIYVDPNFFAWVDVADVQTLDYTIGVFDAETDELLFSDQRVLKWN